MAEGHSLGAGTQYFSLLLVLTIHCYCVLRVCCTVLRIHIVLLGTAIQCFSMLELCCIALRMYAVQLVLLYTIVVYFAYAVLYCVL
jgi:hypothetical protein